MPIGNMEQRVTALEAEIFRLKKQLDQLQITNRPWWEITGTFADDPVYERAMKLGAQYRRSLRPKRGRSGR